MNRRTAPWALVLDARQLAALDLGVNVPSQLLTEMTKSLDRFNESKVELIYQLLMDNDLTTLHKEVARTDRLVSTPTPVRRGAHNLLYGPPSILTGPTVYYTVPPLYSRGPQSVIRSPLLYTHDLKSA